MSDAPSFCIKLIDHDAWLVVPKSPDGGARIRQAFKAIKERVASEPMTDEGWSEAEPARKTLVESGVRGANENLWQRPLRCMSACSF